MYGFPVILTRVARGGQRSAWPADDGGLGFEGGALVFGTAILVIAAAYRMTSVPRTVLFWSAFILTRPLGSTLGDLLTKPQPDGGLHLSRITSSLVIAVVIIGRIAILPQRAGAHPGAAAAG